MENFLRRISLYPILIYQLFVRLFQSSSKILVTACYHVVLTRLFFALIVKISAFLQYCNGGDLADYLNGKCLFSCGFLPSVFLSYWPLQKLFRHPFLNVNTTAPSYHAMVLCPFNQCYDLELKLPKAAKVCHPFGYSELHACCLAFLPSIVIVLKPLFT